MPDLGSQDELTLRRMPDGGFLVLRNMVLGMAAEFVFASTNIDEALDYIRGQIKPITAEERFAANQMKDLQNIYGVALRGTGTV